MNKYFLALAFIFMFAIQGYKSMQEEMEMEIEEEQPNGKSPQKGPPIRRPKVCNKRDNDRCRMICKKQNQKMCWCATRQFGAPKTQCQCKFGRSCPPFPKK